MSKAPTTTSPPPASRCRARAPSSRRKGGVSIQAQHVLVTLADGKQYRIRYDMNAIADYEEAVGKPITKLAEGESGVRDIRALLWAGLQHSHPKLNLRAAGKLIPEDSGALGEIAKACARALTMALGKADPEGDSPGEAGNPIQTPP